MADTSPAVAWIKDTITEAVDRRKNAVATHERWVTEHNKEIARLDELIDTWTAVLEAVAPTPAKRTAKK